MRARINSSVVYAPGDPGGIKSIDDAVRFLRDETLKLKAAIDALNAGHLDKTYAPPEKPRDGDFRYADGVSWNPNGGGRGIYYFDGTNWNQMA